MKKICPSILSADFGKLAEDIKSVESAGADIIHCDIMDGHFVPNLTFGPDIVSKVNEITNLPLDVHLMINSPEKFIESFQKAGADYISVHLENNYHLNRLLNRIKDLKVKAGVAINPSTPVKALEYVLEYADFVLVMSVNPGFGGQKFVSNSLKKVRELKEIILKNNYNCLIEIDGGIGPANIKEVSDAGVDMFVCGASVFKSEDVKKSVAGMKKIIQG
ncbi:MAG TPA: ribulose-phosphate 3-epimerase [Ignavibacteria bacterium]|nr:ribulose-phosphate 3-epimerase [Ignavibacteria bacterium]